MNRAGGSVAGMVIGIAASHLAPHPAIAVAIAIGLTAYVCMGCGWGQAAARIGASLSAVTILAHSQDALEYSMMRVGDTIIGIAAGLAVSYFVLPVRGRDMLGTNVERALDAVARLLAALADGAQSIEPARYSAVFEALVALQKTLADARKEIGGEFEALRNRAREVAVVCVGALSAALAHAELGERARDHAQAAALCEQAAALARRARRALRAGRGTRAPGAGRSRRIERATRRLGACRRECDRRDRPARVRPRPAPRRREPARPRSLIVPRRRSSRAAL
jgi:uncharacterized membrane protein YccC